MTQGENPNVAHYMFIHNVFGNFYKTMLQYYSTYLYPRFEWTVMGTYDKAVEYIKKKEQLAGREGDTPNLPALILNPIGEFGLADAISGAHQPYRFPNLAAGFASKVWEPVYRDENIILTVGFSRVMGDIELIMLCSSFYEYCDLRMYMIQIMGGMDRYIYPERFQSVIIIPPEFYNYEYVDSDGISHRIDWTKANASQKLIETTNKDEWVIPCTIKPIFKLTSLGDASTKYGGDRLADWRLSATINYEVEIPSFMYIETDYMVKNLNMNLNFGSSFTKYPEASFSSTSPQNSTAEVNKLATDTKTVVTTGATNVVNPPKTIYEKPTIKIPLPPMTPPQFAPKKLTDNNPPMVQSSSVPVNTDSLTGENNAPKYQSEIPSDTIKIDFSFGTTVDPDTNDLIIPIVAQIDRTPNKIFKIRYYHIVDNLESEAVTNWEFFLPEVIDNIDLLTVMSRYGKMIIHEHYEVIENGTKLQIITDKVKLSEGDIMELFVYRYDNHI